jgi:hypothetical protein
MRFNEDEVIALARLEHDRSFDVVLKALQLELDECRARLLKASDPVSIYREQGRAEVLDTIVRSAAEAPKRARELQELKTPARSAVGHRGPWTG